MLFPEKTVQNTVPEPTLRRLPWYLAYAKLTQAQGKTMITSTQIAKNIAVDASMVAKDLSYVQISGKTRVGYGVAELIATLENFLGFTKMHRAYLFGVGRLGGALLQDNGLQQYGIEIVAGFDARYELAGTSINHIPIHHTEHFDTLAARSNVKIAILTVPVERAQEVSDLVVNSGFRAIWNFTPYRIRVPEKVVVQNTSIYAHLAVMFNRLNALS